MASNLNLRVSVLLNNIAIKTKTKNKTPTEAEAGQLSTPLITTTHSCLRIFHSIPTTTQVPTDYTEYLLDKFIDYENELALNELKHVLVSQATETIASEGKPSNLLYISMGQPKQLYDRLDIICGVVVHNLKLIDQETISVRAIDIHCNVGRDLLDGKYSVARLGADTTAEEYATRFKTTSVNSEQLATCIKQSVKNQLEMFIKQRRAIQGHLYVQIMLPGGINVYIINLAGNVTDPLESTTTKTKTTNRTTTKTKKTKARRRTSIAMLGQEEKNQYRELSLLTQMIIQGEQVQNFKTSPLLMLLSNILIGEFRNKINVEVLMSLNVDDHENSDSFGSMLDWCVSLRKISSGPTIKSPILRLPGIESLNEDEVNESWNKVMIDVSRFIDKDKSDGQSKFQNGVVQVGICVQPFLTDLETDEYRIHAVHASAKALTVIDPGRNGWSKANARIRFEADYVWDCTEPNNGHKEGVTVVQPWTSETPDTIHTVSSDLIKGILDRSWHGLVSTIFTVGAAGTGKIYVLGLNKNSNKKETDTENKEDKEDNAISFGIIPQIIDQTLIDISLITDKENETGTIEITCVEEYLNKEYDLLQSREKIRNSSKKPTTKTITSGKEAAEILRDAISLRKRDAINRDIETSRSTIVIQIVITRTFKNNKDQPDLIGKIFFVSMASNNSSRQRGTSSHAAVEEAHTHLHQTLVAREKLNTRHRRAKRGAECIASGDALIPIIHGGGVSSIDNLVKKAQQYYPKLNYRKMRKQIEMRGEKIRGDNKFPIWHVREVFSQMLLKMPNCIDIDIALEESKINKIDSTCLEVPHVLIDRLTQSDALKPEAFILAIAMITPSSIHFDDSVKTMRFVQYLNQTVEAEMGEKTGLIHSRRVWQSRINLAMLHRLKEQRKKRQNSDVMLKKLGMIDVLKPTPPREPARSIRLSASLQFMKAFRKSRRKLAIEAVDGWRKKDAVRMPSGATM